MQYYLNFQQRHHRHISNNPQLNSLFCAARSSHQHGNIKTLHCWYFVRGSPIHHCKYSVFTVAGKWMEFAKKLKSPKSREKQMSFVYILLTTHVTLTTEGYPTVFISLRQNGLELHYWAHASHSMRIFRETQGPCTYMCAESFDMWNKLTP